MSKSGEQPIERIYCVATGRVQGVGFRAFALANARRRGLTGWVRNGRDGRTVEMVAEGTREAIHDFLRALRSGPPASNVVNLRQSTLGGPQEFAEFMIRY